MSKFKEKVLIWFLYIIMMFLSIGMIQISNSQTVDIFFIAMMCFLTLITVTKQLNGDFWTRSKRNKNEK
jgi:hypothetical protein